MMAGLVSGCQLHESIDKTTSDLALVAAFLGAGGIALLLRRSAPTTAELVLATFFGTCVLLVIGAVAWNMVTYPSHASISTVWRVWAPSLVVVWFVVAVVRRSAFVRGGARIAYRLVASIAVPYVVLLVAGTLAVRGKTFPGPALDVKLWDFSQIALLPDGRIVASSDGERIFAGDFVATAVSDAKQYALTKEGNVFSFAARPTVVARMRELPPMLAIAGTAKGLCGVSRDRSAYCWSDAAHQPTPPVRIALDDVVQVAVGPALACAIHGAGAVSCWGEAPDAMVALARRVTPEPRPEDLGDDAAEWAPIRDGSRPFAIPGLHGARSIAVATESVCALGADGRVHCLGSNEYGLLGGEGASSADSFPPVEGLEHATTISAGTWHVCALDESGRVFCWGSNGSGQMGDPARPRRQPRAEVVDLPARASSVSAQGDGTCARLVDQRFFCWGARSLAFPVAGRRDCSRKGILHNEPVECADRPGELLMPSRVFADGTLPR
jgi:hypothetical protein